MGDLITTCTSKHGRNRAVGERLARGETLSDIQAGTPMVVEAFTAKSVHEQARQRGIDMPICDEVYRVLYEQKSPRTAVTDLMLRELRSEQVRVARSSECSLVDVLLQFPNEIWLILLNESTSSKKGPDTFPVPVNT